MTIRKIDGLITTDLRQPVLAQYDQPYDSIIKWFEVSSAASFAPRPGTPVVQAASLPATICPPGGATNITGTIDPNVHLIVEYDPLQLTSCSAAYEANNMVPCIDLRACPGAMLRNVWVVSHAVAVVGIGRGTQLGGTLKTVASTGLWTPLIDAEMTAVSLASAIGVVPHWGFQTGGDTSTASLLYTAGSLGKFLKNQAKLEVAYYCVSTVAEQYIVAEVL